MGGVWPCSIRGDLDCEHCLVCRHRNVRHGLRLVDDKPQRRPPGRIAGSGGLSLPLFLFTLPAGALADVIDSRRLLILVESLIVVVSAVFAGLVSFGLATTGALLVATFCWALAGR